MSRQRQYICKWCARVGGSWYYHQCQRRRQQIKRTIIPDVGPPNPQICLGNSRRQNCLLIFCMSPNGIPSLSPGSLRKELTSFTCPTSHRLVPRYLLPVLSWEPGANLCLVGRRLASPCSQKHKRRISVIVLVNSAACTTTTCLI